MLFHNYSSLVWTSKDNAIFLSCHVRVAAPPLEHLSMGNRAPSLDASGAGGGAEDYFGVSVFICDARPLIFGLLFLSSLLLAAQLLRARAGGVRGSWNFMVAGAAGALLRRYFAPALLRRRLAQRLLHSIEFPVHNVLLLLVLSHAHQRGRLLLLNPRPPFLWGDLWLLFSSNKD